jgi:hypothetical protein
MRFASRHATLIMPVAALMACDDGVTPPQNTDGGALGTPITTFTTPASGSCPTVRPKSVLVDPTHDGGVWWFPQAASSPEGFNPDAPHQGQALANYLRDLGYTVTELGRGATLPTDSMRTYATVIRAGYYYDTRRPGYSDADLDAYDAYLACPRTLSCSASICETNDVTCLPTRSAFRSAESSPARSRIFQRTR